MVYLGTKMTLRISSKKKKGEPIAALLENSISASLFLFLFRTPQSLPPTLSGTSTHKTNSFYKTYPKPRSTLPT